MVLLVLVGFAVTGGGRNEAEYQRIVGSYEDSGRYAPETNDTTIAINLVSSDGIKTYRKMYLYWVTRVDSPGGSTSDSLKFEYKPFNADSMGLKDSAEASDCIDEWFGETSTGAPITIIDFDLGCNPAGTSHFYDSADLAVAESCRIILFNEHAVDSFWGWKVTWRLANPQ